MEDWKTGEADNPASLVGDWDGFVRAQIERFLGRYQALPIEFRAQDTDETNVVNVHVPYCAQQTT